MLSHLGDGGVSALDDLVVPRYVAGAEHPEEVVGLLRVHGHQLGLVHDELGHAQLLMILQPHLAQVHLVSPEAGVRLVVAAVLKQNSKGKGKGKAVRLKLRPEGATLYRHQTIEGILRLY